MSRKAVKSVTCAVWITGATLLSGLVTAAVPPSPASLLSGSTKARVVVVSDPEAVRTFVPREERVRQMFDRLLTNFTSQPTITAAWRSIVNTNEIIGIKVHTSPGPQAGTRPATVATVVGSLIEAGFRPEKVIVWDRNLEDLRRAGMGGIAAQYGVQLAGAAEAGYDDEVFYETPLLGNLIWGDLEFGRTGEGLGRRSYVSKLITRRIGRIINLVPLLNHNTAGVSGNMYGLVSASVDNFLRFEPELSRLATAVPDIYRLPALEERVALNVMDALICQYMGEQRTLLHYSTTLSELWMSKDPVALDVLALRELEVQRKAAGQVSTGKPMEIYQNAELLEIGVADLNRVQVEKLE